MKKEKNQDNFKKFLEKYKPFRVLSDQYKSTKFIKLYLKMYEYMLSIPKEKIIQKTILKRNEYIQYLFSYIYKFIETKNFYNWKDRIYSLLTEKLAANSKRKYELLYGSKWKEFFNQYQEKTKITIENTYGSGITNVSQIESVKKKKEESSIKKFGTKYVFQAKEIKEKCKAKHIKNLGVDNPMKSKEIQSKAKKTNLERYGEEYYTQTKEMKEKSKNTCEIKYGLGITNPSQANEVKKKKEETCLKNHGVKNPAQSKEIQEKMKATCIKNLGVEYPLQSKEIQEKIKATCLERYGVICPFQIPEIRNKIKNNSHSKIADDMCLALDTLYGTLDSNNTRYFTKNGEYYLRTEDNNYRYYDYTNVLEKWIVEFQGTYTHGLLEGQEYVFGKPVKEIYRKDEEKRILAEKNGYKVFYVYEDEYRKNPKGAIEKLIKKIKRSIIV